LRRDPPPFQLFLTAMLAWLLLIGVVWLAIEAVAR
jgi:hypothetical protein